MKESRKRDVSEKLIRPYRLMDWPAFIGAEFTGDWKKISENRQEQFYRGTYLDLTYGESVGSFYPAGMVEGFQQVGMLDYLVAEVVGRWHGYNYGLDRVRFLHPLTLDDEIRLKLTIGDVVERGDGYRVSYSATLEIKDRSTPAMVAEWIVLLLPMGETK